MVTSSIHDVNEDKIDALGVDLLCKLHKTLPTQGCKEAPVCCPAQELYEFALQMIKGGNAYVCHQVSLHCPLCEPCFPLLSLQNKGSCAACRFS